jgi:hypothetical protein
MLTLSPIQHQELPTCGRPVYVRVTTVLMLHHEFQASAIGCAWEIDESSVYRYDNVYSKAGSLSEFVTHHYVGYTDLQTAGLVRYRKSSADPIVFGLVGEQYPNDPPHWTYMFRMLQNSNSNHLVYSEFSPTEKDYLEDNLVDRYVSSSRKHKAYTERLSHTSVVTENNVSVIRLYYLGVQLIVTQESWFDINFDSISSATDYGNYVLHRGDLNHSFDEKPL